MMKLKILWPYIGVFLLLGVGLFYDYEITHALYHPQSILGIVFEEIVMVPILCLIPFAFALLYAKQSSIWKMFATILSCSYAIYVCSKIIWLSLPIIFIFLLGVYVGMMMCFHMKRVDMQIITKYEDVCRLFLYVFLTSMLITTLLKGCWGRVRYRELQDIAQYTKWYVIQGMNGNFSFPSGHTAAFSSILCFLPSNMQKYQKKSMLMYAMICGLIVIMMFSRLVMGAHYVSDVAIGFAITYSVYIYYKWKFYKEM